MIDGGMWAHHDSLLFLPLKGFLDLASSRQQGGLFTIQSLQYQIYVCIACRIFLDDNWSDAQYCLQHYFQSIFNKSPISYRFTSTDYHLTPLPRYNNAITTWKQPP
ncbi:hypothetical protein PTI98_011554 [Pleurotus ostreatus]|nr:hypothetical protein PTI98_011554 [Pleurotus ostreatus]